MIKEIIVVEGRDDVTAVKAAVDAEVIAVSGFGINKNTIDKIKEAQKRKGVIILTDPDFAGEKISIEQFLCDGIQIRAGLRAGSRHTVGVGGGVGIAEAAGVGGDGDIQPPSQFLGHFCTHFHQQFVDDLAAGGIGRIHIFFRCERGGRGMVVDAQGNAAQILLVYRRQKVGRCYVHADERIGAFRFFHGQTQQAAAQEGGSFRVIQNMGSLSQLAQTDAQSRGRTDGITVGTGMGQNAEVVVGLKPRGTLIPRHRDYRRADC